MMMTLPSNFSPGCTVEDFIYVAGSFNNGSHKHFCHEKILLQVSLVGINRISKYISILVDDAYAGHHL
jgi:hypothetical protein